MASCSSDLGGGHFDSSPCSVGYRQYFLNRAINPLVKQKVLWYWKKIDNLKADVEKLLMKNRCTNFYTPIGCCAKTLEWIALQKFHPTYMIAAVREKFRLIDDDDKDVYKRMSIASAMDCYHRKTLINDEICVKTKEIRKFLDEINKLDSHLFIPSHSLINHDIEKLNNENYYEFGDTYCQYCPNLKYFDKKTAAYSKHVLIHHPNHFEESTKKYFEDADSLSDEDVRDAIAAMELHLIGHDEYEIFLDEGLKVILANFLANPVAQQIGDQAVFIQPVAQQIGDQAVFIQPVAQQIGDQAVLIQQQQQPIEVIEIISDSSDSESDAVTPSVASYANILRQQDPDRGTSDVSFKCYSQSDNDEYVECEKEFQKDLQCSWRNEYAESISNAFTIRNLMCDPRHAEGEIVNLTALVAEVGTIFDFKDNDRKVRGQEVKLIDLSDKKMSITFVMWYSIYQVSTMEWKPFDTIVQLTNVKLQVDKNTNRRFLATTSRTIFKIFPNTREGYQLARYATKLNSGDLLNPFLQQIQPEQCFRNKAIKQGNVAALGDFISRISPGGREQALLHHVMIMTFDLDRAISVKCVHCGRRIGCFDLDFVQQCVNETCNKKSNLQLYFDFNISIGDSTGSTMLLRITGDYAVQILGQVTPEKFISMSKEHKFELKNRFLFKSYEIGIQIEHRGNGTPELNVIHLEPALFSIQHASSCGFPFDEPDVDDSKRCATCKKTSENLKFCSRCRSTSYCNVDCQRADWTKHKSVCKIKVN